MKTFTPAMQVMLNVFQAAEINLATLAIFTRTDGRVYRFCAYDQDIFYGGNWYERALGLAKTDVQTTDALEVDNLNVRGALNSESITEGDLRAGRWDYADFRIFMINPTNEAHGEIKLRRGRLGEVTLGRSSFEVELRGMMQEYSRIVGRIYAPSCDATLGDARCGVNLGDSSSAGAFTVTGDVDSVSDDGMTIYDADRTEPGPSGSVAITGITQADPGVVTTADPHGFIEGQAIMHSGIGGMTIVNGPQTVHNPTETTYEIINTEELDAYTSGGEAVAFDNSGWFDFGVIRFADDSTGGQNAGLQQDVKAYVPGVIALQLPFPYPVAPGDVYEMVAGCDKTLATCIGKFNNVVRFRGFPHLRGNDALVQVGRHN